MSLFFFIIVDLCRCLLGCFELTCISQESSAHIGKQQTDDTTHHTPAKVEQNNNSRADCRSCHMTHVEHAKEMLGRVGSHACAHDEWSGEECCIFTTGIKWGVVFIVVVGNAACTEPHESLVGYTGKYVEQKHVENSQPKLPSFEVARRKHQIFENVSQ